MLIKTRTSTIHKYIICGIYSKFAFYMPARVKWNENPVKRHCLCLSSCIALLTDHLYPDVFAVLSNTYFFMVLTWLQLFLTRIVCIHADTRSLSTEKINNIVIVLERLIILMNLLSLKMKSTYQKKLLCRGCDICSRQHVALNFFRKGYWQRQSRLWIVPGILFFLTNFKRRDWNCFYLVLFLSCETIRNSN